MLLYLHFFKSCLGSLEVTLNVLDDLFFGFVEFLTQTFLARASHLLNLNSLRQRSLLLTR